MKSDLFMNILKILPGIIYFILFPLAMCGQNGAGIDLERDVERIENLFRNDMHVSVQNEVAKLVSKKYPDASSQLLAELESYSVISGIKLKHKDVDGLVVDFEGRYPHSPRISLIKFHQALYYFERGDYPRTLSIMKSVENKYLSESQRLEYMFTKSYCQMRVGDNDEAMAGFRKILSLGRTPYYTSSSYYTGYLYYISGNFTQAIEHFKVLDNNHEYSLLSQYYISESYFMMKEHQKAIDYGLKVYDKLTGEFRLKSVRILSQSYFELDDSREAKKYLEMYSNQSENLSRKDNYYSGVVSYSLKSYYAAIDAFSKVVNQKDSLAQNGYLYLGNCYLNVKNKLGAMGSFREASLLDYDLKIQEEAFFLYAKLAFDLNADINPFNAYMEKYPSTDKGDEIYSYIATSYLQNKNFKEAISALERVESLTPEMVLNLQKAAFFRAMQLLEMSSYRSAIEYFEISIANGAYNQSLAMLAKFWMGEAYYRNNDFNKCLEITRPLVENSAFVHTREYPDALMNMGYSLYELENYTEAKLWFEKCAGVEAKCRLADCHFMMGDYKKGAELYQSVANATFRSGDIYATYMGAMSYGLDSEPQKKISMLQDIVREKGDSDYYHMSMYELGRTYVQEEENNEAIKCFETLLADKRDSTYYTKSLLELGMINSNLSRYDKALGYFMTIVEKYPLSEDVLSALAGIESVYQLLNKPDKYLAYLDKVGMSSVKSADEKEQMLFNGAEQLYLSGKYSEALASLKSFLDKYPEGGRVAQAHFYLADSYYKTGKPEFAADAYLKVMNIGEGAFLELATLYYGKIELELEHFDKAAYAFESLESIAQLENNKMEAKLGKLRAYYGGRQFHRVTAVGEPLISSGLGDANVVREISYKVAKSHLSLGNRDAALPLFKKLSADYSTAEGAESAYILISNGYDEGNFDEVENLVYAFSDAGTSQMYWLAKSFIVLGDSFAERGEWEQAKATFESVKEGYKPEKEHDDVLEQVEMRLSKIKENENK